MSDLQFSKATGASPSFTMVHKMGLVKLDMTTGKSVPTTVTWTYSQANGSYTVSGNQNSDPHTNIYPYHTFNTTTASGYGIPVNAATAGSDCYFVVKSTSSSANTLIKFGCNTQSTKEYWSDITISNVGYGKYSVSTITSNRTFANLIALFSCVGTCQTITLPWYGAYQMQCWGSNGVNHTRTTTHYGGIGGYVSGNITLPKDKILFVYVGNQSGFNGGGIIGPSGQEAFGANGGGATDIRLIRHTGAEFNTTWDGLTSFRSRLIVAAGGGGANNRLDGYGEGDGGYGGGLTGGTGQSINNSGQNYSYFDCYGGGQTSGGTVVGHGSYASYDNTDNYGQFGYAKQHGITPPHLEMQGAAGGGWYGGGARAHSGAGGGSSFISGHPGCNGVNNSTGSHLGASQPSIIGGETYTFTSTTMIDGGGCQWTTTSRGSNVGRPANPGGVFGYAKITSQ